MSLCTSVIMRLDKRNKSLCATISAFKAGRKSSLELRRQAKLAEPFEPIAMRLRSPATSGWLGWLSFLSSPALLHQDPQSDLALNCRHVSVHVAAALLVEGVRKNRSPDPPRAAGDPPQSRTRR
jgi:hypothetical protein